FIGSPLPSLAAERLHPLRRTYEDAGGRPTVPACICRGVLAPRLGPEAVGAPGRTSVQVARGQPPDEITQLAGIDGLDDVASEACVQEPGVAGIEPQGRNCHDRDPRRPRIGSERPRSLRSVEI